MALIQGISTALGWLGTRATGAAILGAGTLGAQGYYASQTGERSWFSEAFGFGGEEFAAAGARGNAEGMFMGLYAILERFGEFLQSVTDGRVGGGLVGYAREMQGLEEVGSTLDTTGMSPTLLSAQEGDITTSFSNTANAFGMGLSGGFANILGHGADLIDWGAGNVLSVVGIDTGHENRDLSQAWMRNTRNTYAEIMGAPDLRGGWARAADNIGHGTSYVATAVVGGWALGLKSLFASAVTSPSINVASAAIPAVLPRNMTQQQITNAIS